MNSEDPFRNFSVISKHLLRRTCGLRGGVRTLRLENGWKQLPLELFDRRTMGRVDHVRSDVQRRLDARVRNRTLVRITEE
jgi:hypothetical protein